MTRAGVAVVVLLSAAVAAQPAAEPAITGLVIAADGKPVPAGVVAITSSNGRITAAIARTGQFRLVPDTAGRQSLFIAVPGAAPYRANLNVPSSRTMVLPDIQLLPATYYRVRPVSPTGEPMGRGVRWSPLDADNMPLPDPLQHTRDEVDTDGTITIGPLPLGRTMLVFDRAPYAPTRLRDATVNGSQPMIDAGTIVIAPAARLQVDLVDDTGAPVKQHDVWVEDAIQPSPLMAPTVRTDEAGHAVFDRLAVGRYRVWTRTEERCGAAMLLISRLVTTSSGGLARTRIVVGGRASLRVKTPIGPLLGRGVSLKPEAPPQTPLRPMIVNSIATRRPIVSTGTPSCNGVTDSDGAVTFSPMPPGPSELTVQLFNSTYHRRVTVPENGAQVTIEIPDGLIPVKVIDASTRRPIVASVVWLGGGGRVEATTTANGDALIEGTGSAGGTLTISASRYQTLEGAFTETPDTVQEVELMPLRSEAIAITITTDDNKPLPNAAVEVRSDRLGDAVEISATDGTGVARFSQLPPGNLRVRAHAEGFADGAARVGADAGGAVTIALTRVQ